MPGSTTAVSPIDHILETGEGVCQDYAHVMIAIARSWGVPTRYVSGYVSARKAGMSAPQSATHAWAECFLPDLGWTEFDPTNPELPSERRVRVAVGRDYHDVSPPAAYSWVRVIVCLRSACGCAQHNEALPLRIRYH